MYQIFSEMVSNVSEWTAIEHSLNIPGVPKRRDIFLNYIILYKFLTMRCKLKNQTVWNNFAGFEYLLFFLWGHLKHKLYLQNAQSLAELKHYISKACEGYS